MSAPWLSPPNITAPDCTPEKAEIEYGISAEFPELASSGRRRTPLFQVWAHAVGQLPPLPNIVRFETKVHHPTLTTLHDAVACFKGVNRPHTGESDGDSILVYVLNPEVSIKYLPSMVCVAESLVVPKHTVLTVQVAPSGTLQETSSGVSGILTRMEFVSSTPEEPQLPVNHADRYGQRCW